MVCIYNKKQVVQYLWSSLVVATIIGCAVFVHISVLYVDDNHSDARLKYFSKRPEKLTKENCTPVCDSLQCVHHARSVLNRMNPTADACVNFYELVCGNYLSRFQLNESYRLNLHFSTNMENVLENLIESIKADPHSARGKVKTVYDSCRQRNALDIDAIPTMLQFLSSVGIPDWPNIDTNFKFTEPNLENVLSNFLKFKEYAFIDIDAKFIYREDFYAQVNASVLTSTAAYEKKRPALRKSLLENVLVYFDIDSETVNKIWRDSEAIRDALENLKQESERINNEIEDLTESVIDCASDSGMKWKPLCTVLESFVEVTGMEAGISKRFADISGSSAYFLENLFQTLSNFSDRSIANYIAINLVFNHFGELNFHFLLTLQNDPDFRDKIFGDKLPAEHNRRCIKWLSDNLFILLGHEYMREVLTDSVMKELASSIEEFIREVEDAISNQIWISPDVRMQLKQMVGKISHRVDIYEDALKNETFLNKLYDQFQPTDSTFLENMFEYQRFLKDQETSGTLMAEDMLWLRPDILKPNAGGGGDSLDIYFGLLMPPLFSPGIQRVLNLVSLGLIAIHEIGHVLNQYTDSLKRADQGLHDYMDEFSTCLNNQYSQFKFQHLEKNMNGSQYLRENYADAVAISIIDKIIAKYSSENDEFLLPGFPYSTQQMLYISSFQVWCEPNSKEDEEMNDKHDSHVLAKFRLIGAIQNSRGFSKAFSCPGGSYMNPSTKCVFPK